MDVYYRGPNNHLWTSWWPDTPSSQWWSAPKDLGGVTLASAPTAVTGGQHGVDVYYQGPNSHLWTSWWPETPGSPWWSAPNDLGGVALASTPAAVTGGQHRVDVFYKGPNSHLWTSWWPDTLGSQWWSAPVDLGGVVLASAPAASIGGQHQIDVFYQGPNNHLWTSWWPDTAGQWWSAPVDLGGAVLSSAPTVAATGRDKLDVFYRGPNSHLWTSWWPSDAWYDAQSHQPAPNPAVYDLVTRIFDSDNGLPDNPMLGSQTKPTPQLADPTLCGGGPPWKPPCTGQATWIDAGFPGKCLGTLGGHANWGLALYEGKVIWENHSYYTQDDDYSFALYRDDLAGMTQVDVGKKEYLHSEFDSDQTINKFHASYWDALHRAVDDDTGGKGGVLSGTPKPPYTRTRAIFDGREAIVMGLYGLDSAHTADRSCTGDCGAELHPVYAIAIRINNQLDLNDDTWAIFVRNWGDEGYCSSGQERIATNGSFTFSFRFKMPGATHVESIDASSSDASGEHGTRFFGGSDRGGAGTGWTRPVLIPNEGAVVTFTLPPSSEGGWINGMLHLKWSVSEQAQLWAMYRKAPARPSGASSAIAVEVGPDENGETEAAQTSQAITGMTQAQKAALARAWASLTPAASPVVVPVIPPSNTPQGSAVLQVQHVADPIRDGKDRLLKEQVIQPPSR